MREADGLVAVPVLPWGVEQRLAFIEAQLFWEGSLNRADLVTAFDISVPQASKDLAVYQQQAPSNLHYDKARKCYVAESAFSPRFIQPDADTYLSGLTGHGPAPVVASSQSPYAEHLPIPRRRIDPNVLRLIVAAIREGRSLEISYQSIAVEHAGARWRRVSPHAFAHDGARWHMRAFCHDRDCFLDFILSRCLAARRLGAVAKRQADDAAWNSFFLVILDPNPAFSSAQRAVVAADYGMSEGDAIVRVRRALLPYFQKRLRLDIADYAINPRQAAVVVRNRAEYDAALRAVEPKPD